MEAKYLHPTPSTLGLDAHYKLWAGLTSATTVFDYSLGGKPGTLEGTDIVPAYPGFAFNGTDDFIDVGNQGGLIRTVAMWVNATSIAGFDYPIDINGIEYLIINAGSVAPNGYAGSTVYVDGVAANTITAGKWHLIGLTAAAKTASDLDIGRVEGVGWFTGSIGDVWLFNIAKTVDEFRSIYEVTRGRYGV